MKLIHSAFALLAVAVLAGCAHYRLGDQSKLTYSTISIDAVTNKSYAPQAHTYLSEGLFNEFISNGKLTVLPIGRGETTLEVTLNDYRKQIGATSKEDTGRARSLDLTITATATLRDSAGNVLYSGNFEANDNYYADNGNIKAEQQAMPLLMRKLAAQIARAVVSVW